MFKTFDTRIANKSFNEKSLLHLFCIYSLNKDFITHSECFQIFNFKNNKIKKEKQNKNKTKKNKQTNKSSIQQGTVLFLNKLCVEPFT